jgi:NADPH:quinone reductase
MRAVVVEKLGGPEVLAVGEQQAPQPGPGQLLVRVAAAGVNYMDIYQREGQGGYRAQPPFVPGAEGAGTIIAVGEDSSEASGSGASGSGASGAGLAPGDLVAWAGVSGCYAEQVLVPADRAVRVPPGISAEVAAAVMLQGLTAHYLSSSTYPVRAGDVAVVHAAAGGVGLLLTQMVKRRSGIVVATTSGASATLGAAEGKAELARRAGADYVADYADFRTVVAEVTGSAGAHVVYDGVGKDTFDDSLAALRIRGTMVLYGAASGQVPPFDPQRLNSGGSLFLTRPTLAHYIADRAELEWRAGELFSWIASGELDVRIGGSYPLAEAARAHEDLAARRTTGKLLLIP